MGINVLFLLLLLVGKSSDFLPSLNPAKPGWVLRDSLLCSPRQCPEFVKIVLLFSILQSWADCQYMCVLSMGAEGAVCTGLCVPPAGVWVHSLWSLVGVVSTARLECCPCALARWGRLQGRHPMGLAGSPLDGVCKPLRICGCFLRNVQWLL